MEIERKIMNKGNCVNCECFHPEPLQPKQGQCRLHAPLAIMLGSQQHGMMAMGFWPPVQHADWCMDYRPRTEESPKPLATVKPIA